MVSPSAEETPPQLARFPHEVRDAYARHRSTGATEAIQIVVGAAVRDFLPEKSTFARDHVPADSLRLIEDLGYDSLAIAEIVFFFEDLFRVRIENRDILNIHTVGDLRSFVVARVQSTARRA